VEIAVEEVAEPESGASEIRAWPAAGKG